MYCTQCMQFKLQIELIIKQLYVISILSPDFITVPLLFTIDCNLLQITDRHSDFSQQQLAVGISPLQYGQIIPQIGRAHV